MKKRSAGERSHFAAILKAGMQQLDITIRELSKQLGISYEHARKLQAGEVLPNRLLVEKAAKVVGIPVEELQLAVEHDTLLKKYGNQLLSKAAATTTRISFFRPLLESMKPEQVMPAYAMLLRMVHPAKAKR